MNTDSRAITKDASHEVTDRHASTMNNVSLSNELNRRTSTRRDKYSNRFLKNSNPSNPVDEHLASHVLQRGVPVDESDRIEAGNDTNGGGSSCLQGGDSRIELTTTGVTDKCTRLREHITYARVTDFFLPEEEIVTAAAAEKNVPKASATNETGRSTKEVAAEEVSTYFLNFIVFFRFFFLRCSLTTFVLFLFLKFFIYIFNLFIY